MEEVKSEGRALGDEMYEQKHMEASPMKKARLSSSGRDEVAVGDGIEDWQLGNLPPLCVQCGNEVGFMQDKYDKNCLFVWCKDYRGRKRGGCNWTTKVPKTTSATDNWDQPQSGPAMPLSYTWL